MSTKSNNSRKAASATEGSRKARKPSPVVKLALDFVQDILGKSWDWKDHTCRRALGEAAYLTGSQKDPVTGVEVDGYKPELVMKALRLARSEMPWHEIKTMNVIKWTDRETGRTWYQRVCEPSEPPPLYDKLALADWLEENVSFYSDEYVIELRRYLEG